MPESYVSTRVREELARIDKGVSGWTREKLAEWIDGHEGSFSKEDLVELRAMLATPATHELEFAELVPDGWFRELLTWTKQTESPSSFYFLAAASVIGALVGRKVVIDRGTYRIFPSISGLILSPAGRGRRSTACDLVVYGLGRRAGLPVLADSFTYEAMGEALAGLVNPEALVYVGELSVLLGKGSYGESIIPKLTDLIGKTSSFEWRTVKRGLVTFDNPCIAMLATSAPDWLAANIPAVAFGGGFLSRFIVSVEKGAERAVAWGDALDEDRRTGLIDELKEMRKRVGVMGRPGKQVMTWWEEWYHENKKRLDVGDVTDEKLMPYLARKHDHLLRMAAVLAIAGGDERLQFTVRRFEQALAILNWYEARLPLAYSAMALGPIGQAQHAVIKALERAGGMLDHSTLHKKIYRLAPLSGQFQQVVQSLVEMSVVDETTSISGRGKVYVLRRGLED